MKTFSQRAAFLQKVRRTLRRRYGKPVPEVAEDVALELLRFVLLEGTTQAVVRDALARLEEAFVDLNEFRVSPAREIAEVIPNVPQAHLKGARLTKLFNAVFLKHNAMDWDFVRSMGVREVRQYFEKTSGGDPALGAAAVMFFSPGHAVPADSDVCRVLARLEIIQRNEEIPAVQSFLERAVTRDQGFETWALIRRVAEAYCVSKAPLCGRCPLRAVCTTGQARLLAGKKAARKSRKRPTVRKDKAKSRSPKKSGAKKAARKAGRKKSSKKK